jgi:Helix-turn-helix domain
MSSNCCQNVVFFPDGRPVPEVLTEQEAIEFLRLDDGPKHPKVTLQYYRTEGLLKGVNIGKKLRYTKTDMLRFLERLSDAKEEKFLNVA